MSDALLTLRDAAEATIRLGGRGEFPSDLPVELAKGVLALLARLSAAEQDRDEARRSSTAWMVASSENRHALTAAEARAEALNRRLVVAEANAESRKARAEAADKVMCEIETEIRFRASTTNEFGQCDPPYTAHSLLSMADELAAALAGREETGGGA